MRRLDFDAMDFWAWLPLVLGIGLMWASVFEDEGKKRNDKRKDRDDER